jgi:hypothetical protein
MNVCLDSGYLVSAKQALPSDPTEFGVPRLPFVGCNRLRCNRCGATVRTCDGYAFATRDDQSQPTLSGLYDTADLTTSPLLHQTLPSFRLYLCRCSRWLETSEHALQIDDPDWFTDPKMPWACDGHPYVEPPHDIDGVRVTSTEELRALISRGFAGFVPPRTRPDDPPAVWLVRLHARLAPSLKPYVEQEALAALEKAPDAKARAFAFFFRAPNDQANARILTMLERDRATLAVIPDAITTISIDKTLDHSAWRVLQSAIGADGPVRTLARAHALAGHGCRTLYSGLASGDASWLLEHLEDVARAAGTQASALLASLHQLPTGSPITKSENRIKAVLGIS